MKRAGIDHLISTSVQGYEVSHLCRFMKSMNMNMSNCPTVDLYVPHCNRWSSFLVHKIETFMLTWNHNLCRNKEAQSEKENTRDTVTQIQQQKNSKF